jgi:hypothetical protein
MVTPSSVWSDALAAEVSVGGAVTLAYPERDCMGTPRAQWDRSQRVGVLRVGPSGTLFRIADAVPSLAVMASTRRAGAECENVLQPGSTDVGSYIDTGAPWTARSSDELAVEMR